ncbi:MAG: D-glycero-beta-D-manno-heptose-1,7-bisphosphate 7-phosphatase [Rickettsiales bacterium]|nr:D-glycero-beta-D-manno-heptose-1,7-bisphosphate 7-phosphatase [Rickettsiales bacterium]
MLVLLDRDGVINVDLPNGVIDTAQLELIPGSAEAIARLNAADIRVAICTNQSNIGRGNLTEDQLAEIHQHLKAQLAESGAEIDAIYFAPDRPDAASPRRKPSSGMLQEALHDFHALPAETPFIGDAITDLQAAQAIGCPFYLVRTGKGRITASLPELRSHPPLAIVDDLSAAVDHWLRLQQKQA